MTLSRKDFLRQSFYCLGEALVTLGETVREARSAFALRVGPSGDGPAVPGAEPGAVPVPGPGMVARPDNAHCPARSCGCFSCIERCQAEAISLVPGEGLRIDPALCTGCGDCFQICPLAPQALTLVPRDAEVRTLE